MLRAWTRRRRRRRRAVRRRLSMGGTEEHEIGGELARLLQHTQQRARKPWQAGMHRRAACRCRMLPRLHVARVLGVEDQGALRDGRRASCRIRPQRPHRRAQHAREAPSGQSSLSSMRRASLCRQVCIVRARLIQEQRDQREHKLERLVQPFETAVGLLCVISPVFRLRVLTHEHQSMCQD